MAKLSFSKVATVPSSGNAEGRIYFETTTGLIHVGLSDGSTEVYGEGVTDAKYNQASGKVTFTGKSGTFELDLKDIASASSVVAELNKKLNIGEANDASSVPSYYGLKKYVDEQIDEIPAAIEYKADGTSLEQSGSSEVTFSVKAVAMDKVTGLNAKLSDLETAANAVKSVAGTPSQYITASNTSGAVTVGATIQPVATATDSTDGLAKASDVKSYVDSAVGGVYRVQGSVADATALKSKESTAKKGDVWNVETAGMLNDKAFEEGSNFVWTGTEWDKLGGTIDLSAYAKTTDLKNTDAAVDHEFVTAAVEANGIVTVSRRGIEVDDLPSITTAKISDMNSTLANYVPTTRKVNDHALSGDVTIDGADVKLTGYTKGTNAEAIAADDTINAAIAKLENRVVAAETGGVTMFAGKTGTISLKAASSTNGDVNLAISEGKELSASVVGLGTAAYASADSFATANSVTNLETKLKGGSSDGKDAETIAGAKAYAKDYANNLAGNYATAAQGEKADSALQSVSASSTTTKYVTANAADKSNGAQAITVAAVTGKVEDNADALAVAADVKSYVDTAVEAVMAWEVF